MKYIIILLVLVFSGNIYSQSVEKISKERYTNLVDSLTAEKNSLTKQKQLLIAQIDSLEKYKVDLSNKLVSARSKSLVKKYGKEIGSRVANGQIWKGMTEQMLEDSWGKPDKITTNKKKWGIFRQWYYGEITYFFRDGILTDWEEKK